MTVEFSIVFFSPTLHIYYLFLFWPDLKHQQSHVMPQSSRFILLCNRCYVNIGVKLYINNFSFTTVSFQQSIEFLVQVQHLCSIVALCLYGSIALVLYCELYSCTVLRYSFSMPVHLYTSMPVHLYACTLLNLYTSTPPCLYATTPLHLYASTLLRQDTSSPGYLHTSMPLHFFTSTPLRLYTSMPRNVKTCNRKCVQRKSGTREQRRRGVEMQRRSSVKQHLRVAPYSFLTARELILKISRWRELSNSTLKSRTESRSKMPTNMASKFLKFLLTENVAWIGSDFKPFID